MIVRYFSTLYAIFNVTKVGFKSAKKISLENFYNASFDTPKERFKNIVPKQCDLDWNKTTR